MAEKHRWTMEEDVYCCRRYVEQYVIKKSSMEFLTFLKQLDNELEDVQQGSIRMKIQNIKQVLMELEVEDTLVVSPLKQYSKQNRKAMEEVLKEMNIMY